MSRDRPSLRPMTSTQAELLDRAVDTAIERDQWRRLALHLERTCEGNAHCPFTWRSWKASAEAALERTAVAERALAFMLQDSPAALDAIKAWRLTYGPPELANTPTPDHWTNLAKEPRR